VGFLGGHALCEQLKRGSLREKEKQGMFRREVQAGEGEEGVT
jgi:hypothetical protein